YLAKVEGAARSGGRGAGGVAALALHSAAQFELSRGDTEHALTDEKTALTYAPQDPVILMNVAYLHLRRSEYKVSLEYLEHARRVAPDDPDVAKLSGWAYYGMNKLDQAVAEFRRALALRPDSEVQSALAPGPAPGCRSANRPAKGPAQKAEREQLPQKRKQPFHAALQRRCRAGTRAR